MNDNRNQMKANNVYDSWPDWKKDFLLTKYSSRGCGSETGRATVKTSSSQNQARTKSQGSN